MFLLNEAVKLLVGERREIFKYERAIRLFQFHVWTLSSHEFLSAVTSLVSRAGQLAGVKFLDYLEEEQFVECEGEARRFRAQGQIQSVNLADKPPQRMDRILWMRDHSLIYREIYDHMLGMRGGLLGLVGTPSLREFDCDIAKRQESAEATAGVVDYRLRYIQHGPGDKRGASPSHAFHFMWGLTKNIPGKQGARVEGKSLSKRTLADKWRQYERSAIFLYLNERHGFAQSPIPIDDVEFVPKLLRQSEEGEELRRYFGAYAYIAASFKRACSEKPVVKVPDTIQPVPISTEPFSDAELKIIAAYKEDKPLIDTKLEPDDIEV
jgi:hypothetical protein